jgi:hypothetical protein
MGIKSIVGMHNKMRQSWIEIRDQVKSELGMSRLRPRDVGSSSHAARTMLCSSVHGVVHMAVCCVR